MAVLIKRFSVWNKLEFWTTSLTLAQKLSIDIITCKDIWKGIVS